MTEEIEFEVAVPGAKRKRVEPKDPNYDQLYKYVQQISLQGRSTISKGEVLDSLTGQR